ncbi:hypothetical protein U1Q18_006788 [Sarracenia purpurea var. burkii]
MPAIQRVRCHRIGYAALRKGLTALAARLCARVVCIALDLDFSTMPSRVARVASDVVSGVFSLRVGVVGFRWSEDVWDFPCVLMLRSRLHTIKLRLLVLVSIRDVMPEYPDLDWFHIPLRRRARLLHLSFRLWKIVCSSPTRSSGSGQ